MWVAIAGWQDVEQKTGIDLIRIELKATHTNVTVLAARLLKLEADLCNERVKEAKLAKQIEIAEIAVARESRTLMSG